MILNRDHCFYLGVFTKIQGVKGNLYAFFDTDHPENYADLDTVLVEMDTGLVPMFISSVVIRERGKVLVKLEGIDSVDQARELVGRSLLLPVDRLPELGPQQFYYHEVVGFALEDVDRGVIGTIREVLQYTGNPNFAVETPDGKEVLVPIQDAFLKTVDKPGKRIVVQTPPGLLALYLDE